MTGVRAEVVSWRRTRNNALPPQTVEVLVTTGTGAGTVHDVVLLPDRFHPARPPRSVDRKDGGTHVAPRFRCPETG